MRVGPSPPIGVEQMQESARRAPRVLAGLKHPKLLDDEGRYVHSLPADRYLHPIAELVADLAYRALQRQEVEADRHGQPHQVRVLAIDHLDEAPGRHVGAEEAHIEASHL